MMQWQNIFLTFLINDGDLLPLLLLRQAMKQSITISLLVADQQQMLPRKRNDELGPDKYRDGNNIILPDQHNRSTFFIRFLSPAVRSVQIK